MSHVFVTGGAGYIGSHTLLQLLQVGHRVTVLDNLCNASREAIRRVEGLSGQTVSFVEGDIRDADCLASIFNGSDIDSVIHFAGLKAVGESVQKPLAYYENNVYGTLVLCQQLERFGIRKLVFSSSATVYGDPQELPLNETMPTGSPTNPYGWTKLMIEQILRDLHKADNRWDIALLRYFNPVGAHPSGQIGEHPSGIPNNLMPFIAQVATGRRDKLMVYGDDYDTPDGTGVRDYIHVEDLANGHLKALEKLDQRIGLGTYNLGTGTGYSVLGMIRAFEKASGKTIPYKIAPRREGDIAACYADPTWAEQQLGWRAEKGIDEMCADTWRWQSANPNGYDSA